MPRARRRCRGEAAADLFDDVSFLLVVVLAQLERPNSEYLTAQ